MQPDRATLAEHLTRLLQAEADAVRAGRMDMLETLAGKKSDLLSAFAAARGDLRRDRAAALQQAARRSERLLAAALRGARSAKARHTAILRAATGFETYDPRGARQTIGGTRVLLEKKA